MAEEATKDFFISYNKADRGWAEWIAWQLEAEGYSTILQAWDFRPGGNFILEMDHATMVATRTIAVLSPDYLDALYTKPEWAEAFRQDPTGKDGKLLPVRVRTCTLKGLLAAIGYIDLVGRNNALAAQNALLAGVRRSRAIPSTAPIFPGDASPQPPEPPPAFPGNWPLVWNVPYRRNRFFTGRETLLTTLHEQLTGKKAVALTQTLAIHGLGGIGKTQTAVEYAYRYQQRYQAVFWVRAAALDTLCSDYVSMAGLLHLAEKDDQDQIRILHVVKQWLSRQKEWLLILDNADDLEIIPDYLPAGENGHILLTTRDPSVQGMAQGIEVEQMDVQEGIDLLLRRARMLTPETPLEAAHHDDREAAERIVTAMGGVPLAIDQAAAYIEQTRCGLSGYLQLYQQHRADLLRWKRRVPSDYPRTVAATWAVSFEQVEQRNPAATDLLRLCAFLDPDGIPEDLLQEGASELGPDLQSLVEDAFRWNEAMDLLRSFSLIRRLVESKSLAMHRLVQVVLKDRLDSPTQQQWAERVVRLVNAAFPEVSFQTWEQCKQYLPQVFICLDHLNQHGIQTPEAASLLHRAGWYLNEHARNTEAEPLYQRALAIYEKTRGPEHPDTSATLYNLAQLYKQQGRYQEAEPLIQRSVAIDEKCFGPEHLEVAVDLENYADLLERMQRTEEAAQLKARIQAIRAKQSS